MNTRSLFTLTLVLIARIAASAPDAAPLPFVSPMFGDHMVLQRGKPNTIWGWSKPGQPVQVEIAGRIAKTVTGPDGRWQVKIRPPAPGGPYTIRIEGAQSVELHDVLVGDVWLCGGQSNMQLGLARTRNGADEIKSANHPEIRLYIVQAHPAYSPSAVPHGRPAHKLHSRYTRPGQCTVEFLRQNRLRFSSDECSRQGMNLRRLYLSFRYRVRRSRKP